MRLLLPLFFLAQISLAQSILPAFESSLLQEVWIDQDLKGLPEKFTVEEYNYNPDSARLFKSEITRVYFYEFGKLRRVEFLKSGTPIKTYSYDAYGRITEQTRTDKFESIPKITYTYNDDQLTAEETVYRITGTVHSKTVLRFNDKQQLISKEEYRGTDKLNRYWLYSYNNQNDLISDEYFDVANGLTTSSDNGTTAGPSISTQKKYEYDEGLKTSEKTLEENTLISSTQYRYFTDSVIKETVFFQANGSPTEKHVEVKHDSARIVVKGYFNSDDTTSYRSRFKEIYVDGDLIEYESRTLRGTFIDRYTTFYEYDHKGNWIKKTTYSNGITLKVEERRIRY